MCCCPQGCRSATDLFHENQSSLSVGSCVDVNEKLDCRSRLLNRQTIGPRACNSFTRKPKVNSLQRTANINFHVRGQSPFLHLAFGRPVDRCSRTITHDNLLAVGANKFIILYITEKSILKVREFSYLYYFKYQKHCKTKLFHVRHERDFQNFIGTRLMLRSV